MADLEIARRLLSPLRHVSSVHPKLSQAGRPRSRYRHESRPRAVTPCSATIRIKFSSETPVRISFRVTGKPEPSRAGDDGRSEFARQELECRPGEPQYGQSTQIGGKPDSGLEVVAERENRRPESLRSCPQPGTGVCHPGNKGPRRTDWQRLRALGTRTLAERTPPGDRRYVRLSLLCFAACLCVAAPQRST